MKRLALTVSLAVAQTLAASPTSAQNYKILQSQSELELARILRSGINSAGYPCTDATTIQFNGSDREDAGYWAVACSDGGNWMVQVENNDRGTISVTPCELLKVLKIECWEKF